MYYTIDVKFMKKGVYMKHYLFPKFFADLSIDAMMEKCAAMGFDGPTLLIRDGHQVCLDNLETALPHYMKAAETSGLEVRYAQTDITMENVQKEEDLLRRLADAGITSFRLAHLHKRRSGIPPRELADHVRSHLSKVAETAEKAGIKAIVQIHGMMYPHNATSAYMALKDLDPTHIGVKLDPGNNVQQEGFELWNYQIPLLGEYISALGIKDANFFLHPEADIAGGKQFVRRFVPLPDGVSDYPQILTELQKIGFSGPAVFMPFYNEKEPDLLEKNLARELAYFKELEGKIR